MAKALTPTDVINLKTKARDTLAETRRTLLQRAPFIGNVAMQLDLVPVHDSRLGTACTDGQAIYFDVEFMKTLSRDELLFVFAHEVWHNIMLHFTRQGNRNSELFNKATDLEVNQLLIKDGLVCPKSALTPQNMSVPCDLNAESYYDILLKRNKPNNEDDEDDDDDQQDMYMPGDKSGNSNVSAPNHKLDGQFDRHIFVGEKLEDPTDYSDDDFRPFPTESNVEKVREAAVATAQAMERTTGSLPGHIKKIINNLLEPEISWQELLTASVTRAMGESRTWNTPNRRFAYTGTYLPSSYSNKIKVAVGIDTSGSTSGSLKKFLSEVNGLVKSFGSYELTLIQCDTEVKSCETYNEDRPLDLENDMIEMKGFGGTILHPIFECIKDKELDIDTAIIFTDGEIDTFKADEAPEFPVTWLLTKEHNTDAERMQFGERIVFKD